uniref:FAR1 domain-containing protein n=1 Tax=Medicago truncatula TaxID=3880 RepID=I3SVC7_MEDTR|nr:unknown [Medicago truncatula]
MVGFSPAGLDVIRRAIVLAYKGNLVQFVNQGPALGKGCKAMIHIKYDQSGKWMITKFVKDHNHPLVVSPREARQTMDEKDKKIQELTVELRIKKRLCVTYQEQLKCYMNIVEEHSDKLSARIHHILDNLKEYESIEELLHQT